jgi:hypothetical protein
MGLRRVGDQGGVVAVAAAKSNKVPRGLGPDIPSGSRGRRLDGLLLKTEPWT